MQLQHYAQVPWQEINVALEIVECLQAGDIRRLQELHYIAALRDGDDELAEFISSSL